MVGRTAKGCDGRGAMVPEQAGRSRRVIEDKPREQNGVMRPNLEHAERGRHVGMRSNLKLAERGRHIGGGAGGLDACWWGWRCRNVRTRFSRTW